jgi:predicted NBD/HSP70 family sugar kinase
VGESPDAAYSLQAGSPPLLRRLNSALLLRVIRSHGPVSRAELARTTGLSKPTVNEVADRLLRAGYVSETIADRDAQPRRPGPRARLLSFRADFGHVLGLDIGATKVLAMVADLNGNVLAQERRQTGREERRDGEVLLARVRETARAALTKAGVRRSTLRAVGVGTPGVVDPASGQVTLAPQLEGWEDIALGRRLERSFPCVVLVDNEVHLAVVAERWRGAAQGVTEAVYVNIGVGIGGGVLIGGDLYRGAAGAAGEIGYLPLPDPAESHDDLGPFEHAAGGAAFARLGRAAVAHGRGALLLELADSDPEAIDAEVVFTAAERGDAAASQIVDELLERLARGIAAAAVVLNPEAVIIGGGVTRAGERLLEPLTRRIPELVPVPPRVLLSTLGEDAVALGAVRLAVQAVEERLFDIAAVEAV